MPVLSLCKFVLVLLSYSVSRSPVNGLKLEECDGALGMETGDILDEQISASSSFAVESVGPPSARIRTHRNGGAWCPSRQIDQDTREYLEIDLRTVHLLTSVETQGRYGGGQGREYPTQYLIQYWRPGARDWMKYKNRRGEELITGNTDTYTAVIRRLNPAIIASKIRFIPFSVYARTTCMRIELYGCRHLEGVLSYTSPQGYHLGSVDYSDHTYDGFIDEQDSWMADGLGQLTDGQLGHKDAFTIDDPALSKDDRGAYPWIGWSNNTNGPWMEIIFSFDVLRNFSECRMHVNVDSAHSVLPPDMVKLWFSYDGKVFKTSPVIFKVSNIIQVSWIRIAIPHAVGKYVKMELNLPGSWLMISEVSFLSRTIPSNLSVQLLHVNFGGKAIEKGESTPPPSDDSLSVDTYGVLPPAYIALIIGVMLGTIAICSLIILIIVIRNKKHKNKGNCHAYSGLKIPPAADTPLNSTLVMQNGRHLTLLNTHKDKIDGQRNLSQSPVLRRHLIPGIPPPIPPRQVTLAQTPDGNLYITDARKTPLQDDISECNITPPIHTTPGRTPNSGMSSLPSWEGFNFPPPPPTEGTTDSSEYAEPTDLSRSAATLPLLHSPSLSRRLPGTGVRKPIPPPRTLPKQVRTPRSPPRRTPSNRSGSNCIVTSPEPTAVSPRHRMSYKSNKCLETVSSSTDAATTQSSLQTTEDDDLHYASSDIMHTPGCRLSIQGVSGNTTYGCASTSSSSESVVQFDRRNLKFVEKLGEGEFGEVHLCQLNVNQHNQLVAVKLLRRNANNAAKLDFEREMQILSRLQDRNLIQLVGACTQEEPWCMVEEYLPHGDLNQFIRSNRNSIPYSARMYMAAQIASGMKYLESLGFVHRDLATRNCLVGDRFLLKIGDFGMARSIYSRDYYRVDGQCVLPIRWMACECIILGKFSVKSDVWSFAVTLWEIFDLSRRRPFQELNDEQVIDNAQLMIECDPQAVYLDAPEGCPKEMYDLMLECWHSSDSDRPTFREIDLFLQRKSLGFEPSSLPNIALPHLYTP